MLLQCHCNATGAAWVRRRHTADDNGSPSWPSTNDKLHAFLGKFVTDLGATAAAGNVVIGHHLGLYRALAAGPATAEELAGAHSAPARATSPSGCAARPPAATSSTTRPRIRYSMTEEQVFALANPDGGVYAPGAFVLALGALRAAPRITEAFRTGAGLGWHEQDADVFTGCEQFFRPGYIANLVPAWIPALDGVEDKLRAGRQGRRHRLRARRVHHLARAGVPELPVHRV